MRSETTMQGAGPIATLFGEHCSFVWRALRHLGVDEAALDDATQDVFITAHRRWSTFEGRAGPRSWLFGIARRVAFRYRRSAKSRARRFKAIDPALGAGIAEHPMERLHAQQSLAVMLGSLDRDKRAVFVLTELEGMTGPEVSEALRIPLGTAYSRLRAAWHLLGRAAGQEEQKLRRQLVGLRREPEAGARDRMWGGVVAAGVLSGPATPVGVVSVVGSMKWGLLSVATAALVLGGFAVAGAQLRPADPSPLAPVSTEDVRSPVGLAVAATGTTRTPAAIPTADTLPPQPRGAATRVPAGAPSDSAVRRQVQSNPAGPSGDRDQNVPAEENRHTLAEELRLVRDAQTAIRRGDGAAALELLDKHGDHFRDGQLSVERDTARVRALCLLGRVAQAEREATSLGVEPACSPVPTTDRSSRRTDRSPDAG